MTQYTLLRRLDGPSALQRQSPAGLVIVQAPKDQPPGWYGSTLTVRANGETFAVPVGVLVTGLRLPDPRDGASLIGLQQSALTLAVHYKVEVWPPKHWELMEQAFRLMGQLGNDVVYAPVVGANWVPSYGGFGGNSRPTWWPPLIRWTKAGDRLQPDFSLLETYLNVYLKHCGPPRALSLLVRDPASSKEYADAYEGRRIPSREYVPKVPFQVLLWDPKSGAVTETAAPYSADAGAEAFWKPMFEGVREIVKRRGWPERATMVGLGGDIRAGEKPVEAIRRMAPYARWNALSHFSGDPGWKDGKWIGTGGLEFGVAEGPNMSIRGFGRAVAWEPYMENPFEFLPL